MEKEVEVKQFEGVLVKAEKETIFSFLRSIFDNDTLVIILLGIISYKILSIITPGEGTNKEVVTELMKYLAVPLGVIIGAFAGVIKNIGKKLLAKE